MELRQLRYFVGVSEAGSLLQASVRLRVAQPSLGQQITALERELGARLLERSSRGVALTEAGKVFLAHARLVLADAERARQAVRDSVAVPRGEVTLGLTTTVALVATMPILSACRAELPQVRLKVVEAYSGFLREWLLAGRLDVALMYGDGPDPGLAKRALLDDRLVLIARAGQPDLPARLALPELARWPMVLPGPEHALRRIVEDACAPQGVRLNVVAEIESLGSVKRAVEAGIGATILPLGAVAEEVAAGRLATAELDSPRLVRRVVCATHLARPATGASTALAALIRRVLWRMVATGEWPGRWLDTPAEGAAGSAPLDFDPSA